MYRYYMTSLNIFSSKSNLKRCDQDYSMSKFYLFSKDPIRNLNYCLKLD